MKSYNPFNRMAPLSSTAAGSIEVAPPKKNPMKTFKKLFPLGAMLFFILFNYTILRDTKDVLVVTAPGKSDIYCTQYTYTLLMHHTLLTYSYPTLFLPGGGAEIIPFLKTYVNLPSAIGFTVLYSSLCNKFSADKVFYLVMSSFVAFFGAFATVICKIYIYTVHIILYLYHSF